MAQNAPHDLPEYVPEYNKPDAPGIHMNFDNTVSLYHIVEEEDDFETAAQDIFALAKTAQEEFPDWPRVLYLDIPGRCYRRRVRFVRGLQGRVQRSSLRTLRERLGLVGCGWQR